MNKLNFRTVEFTSAENQSTELGYFHLFKKEVTPNGSENIYGVIENIETGKLYEIPIQDFNFQEDEGKKITKTPIPSKVKTKSKKRAGTKIPAVNLKDDSLDTNDQYEDLAF